MRKLTLFGCLLLQGCFFLYEPPPPTNDVVNGPSGWEDAMGVIKEEWSTRIGAPILHDPTVVWYGGECLEYGSTDEDYGCPQGVFWDNGWESEIHLIARDLPSDTSLSHEMLHWVISKDEGHTDKSHMDPLWDEVDGVDDALRDLGL